MPLSSDRAPAPQAAAANLLQMAESLPGALFRYVVAPDGGEKIVYMSPGCVALWEVQNHTIEHNVTALWDMVDGQDFGPFRASIRASAIELSDWSCEWRITTPSGERKWLHGVARP